MRSNSSINLYTESHIMNIIVILLI